MEFVVLLIGVGVVVIMCMRIRNLNNETVRELKKKELSKYAELKSGGILEIKKVTKKVVDNIAMKDAHNVNIAYDPVKLHIGAVSVGGVVSGGAYTTGGKNYVSSIEKSGQVDLTFLDETVFEICFPSEFKSIAKQTEVKRYLKKNGNISARSNTKLTEVEMRQFLMEVENYGMSNLVNKSAPSVEQCKCIIDFLYSCYVEETYNDALELSNTKTADSLKESINKFELIIEYKDSKQLVEHVRKEYETILQKEKDIVLNEESGKQDNKRRSMISALMVATFVVLGIVLFSYIIPLNKYNNAIEDRNKGDYEAAIDKLSGISNYKDSSELLVETYYEWGLKLYEELDYEEASIAFANAIDYMNSNELFYECQLNIALKLTENKNISEAEKIYKDILNNATNASTKKEAYGQYGLLLISQERWLEAIDVLENVKDDYDDELYLAMGKQAFDTSDWKEAVLNFEKVKDKKNISNLLNEAYFRYVTGDYRIPIDEAISILRKVNDNTTSSSILNELEECKKWNGLIYTFKEYTCKGMDKKKIEQENNRYESVTVHTEVICCKGSAELTVFEQRKNDKIYLYYGPISSNQEIIHVADNGWGTDITYNEISHHSTMASYIYIR